MSGIDDAKKHLAVAGSGLHALEMIGKISKGALAAQGFPDDKLDLALGALSSISNVVDAIRAGLDGTRSLEHVDEEIAKLATGVSANDQHGQSELDAKFPK